MYALSLQGPQCRAAASYTQQCGNGYTHLERGLAQEAQVHDEDQQRRDFQSCLGQRHADEVCVVHCTPPASSALTAGSIASSKIFG